MSILGNQFVLYLLQQVQTPKVSQSISKFEPACYGSSKSLKGFVDTFKRQNPRYLPTTDLYNI